jgi:hypothetical protein
MGSLGYITLAWGTCQPRVHLRILAKFDQSIFIFGHTLHVSICGDRNMPSVTTWKKRQKKRSEAESFKHMKIKQNILHT